MRSKKPSWTRFWGPGKPVLDLPIFRFLPLPRQNFDRAHIDPKIAKMAILGGTKGGDLYFFENGPKSLFLGLFGPFLAFFEGFVKMPFFDPF